MGSKKSSFHMGDEFNGSGKKIYLRATQHNTYEPLPQDNVKLTKNFSKCVPKAVGAMPMTSNPASQSSGVAQKALGGLSGMSQVIITKDSKTGDYQTEFTVNRHRLTTGSYLHTSQEQDGKNKSLEQFIKDTVSSFLN